jgi:uncharacterized protein
MQKAKKIIKIFLGIYLLIFLAAVVFQRAILLHPKSLNRTYKYDFAGKNDEFLISPERGVELNLLYFHTTQKPKGVVFYLHGNSDNLVRWGKHASEFTSRGYDVLMYDFRGFGKSSGKLTEENLLKDAQMLYENLTAQFPEQQIVLYGRSLGTGVATKLAADNSPKKLILETPYYNLPDLCWSFLPILPYNLIASFKMPTNEWIQKVRCPIHIFHGTEDNIVLYNQSQKLVQLLKKSSVLTTLQGGHHRGLEKFDTYQKKMNELLK